MSWQHTAIEIPAPTPANVKTHIPLIMLHLVTRERASAPSQACHAYTTAGDDAISYKTDALLGLGEIVSCMRTVTFIDGSS